MRTAAFYCLLLGVIGTTPAFGAELPEGFELELVAGGLDFPITMAMDPEGNPYVGSKDGMVWRVEGGELVEVLDLREEVNGQGDRGLISIALDPDFADNGFLYLLFTADPEYGSPDESGTSATAGRLVRYTVEGHIHEGETEVHWEAADPTSRLVLFGETLEEGFPACSITHSVGSLRFGADGALFISAGEGAHFDYYADIGQDLSEEDEVCTSLFGPDQDIGAMRAQALWSPGGKILRIDPATGLAMPDNPNHTGDPSEVTSKVFASGLRNPWRIAVDPIDGGVWVGDVGEARWEELDYAAGGENFGWPCYEGPADNPQYLTAEPTISGCDTIETLENPGHLHEPLLAWNHTTPEILTPTGLSDETFVGATAMALAVYDGALYPEDYLGRIFFADFTEGWIRTGQFFMVEDGHHTEPELTAIESFASGMPGLVDVAVHPVTGDLYLLNIYSGALERLRYVGDGDQAPVATFTISETGGPSPLTVRVDASASLDPEGETLSYAWDWGDGSPVESRVSLTHTYTAGGSYNLVLRASDPAGLVGTASQRILVDRTPPVAQILSPIEGALFELPEVFRLLGQGTDAEDAPEELTYRWSVVLHHNTHYHPDWQVLEGADVNLPVVAIDENGHLELRLRVTDQDGLSDEDVVHIYPNNRPPTIDLGGPYTTLSGELLEMPVISSDPDGDSVLIETISLPTGAVFDRTTGTIRWTPSRDQVGTHTLRLRGVDDDGAPMSTEAEVEVEVLAGTREALTLEVFADWGVGWCGEVHWVNDTGAIIQGWTLIMGLEGVPFATWSGIWSPVAGGYQVEPVWYNETLNPGDALDVGLCSDGPRPTSAELVLPETTGGDGLDVLLTYSEWGRWGAASCGDVVIRNNEPLPILGWALTFELPTDHSLSSYWLAQITETSVGRYRAQDEGWNAWLEENGGEPQIFGICIAGESPPSNFRWTSL